MRIAKLGIIPGKKFSMSGFSAEQQKAIKEGVSEAQKEIVSGQAKMGKMVNGWQIALDLGRYGTQYLYRATWTYFGVGGNLVEDAIYPLGVTDSDGKILNAANEANWLPAPKGDFKIALRLYVPKKSAAEGTWTPPPVQRY